MEAVESGLRWMELVEMLFHFFSMYGGSNYENQKHCFNNLYLKSSVGKRFKIFLLRNMSFIGEYNQHSVSVNY